MRRRCEEDPRYRIEMCFWHEPDVVSHDDEPCAVCFAGAVMAQTLECDFKHSCTPSDFDDDIRNKLTALNEFGLELNPRVLYS
ncbi:MAG: hypothetical protein ACREAU_01235 [Nitrosopumilaceae archaeon]